MTQHRSDTIELLSPSLIDIYPEVAAEIDKLCSLLGMDIGWHYILDLIWILGVINLPPGSKILDAGAGRGVLQFALAERGFTVISVDFSKRRIPLLAALLFPITDEGGPIFDDDYLRHLQAPVEDMHPVRIWISRIQRISSRAGSYVRGGLRLPSFWLARELGRRKPGKIYYHRSDMRKMDDIESNSIDAVVSLSAVEHMEQAGVPDAMQEFRRVLKPGGIIAITTNAAHKDDWYHAPSRAWCFSEQTIRKLFGVDNSATSNWQNYEDVMSMFLESDELQRRLSPSYRFSGQNGMPWGKWDPKYLSVGILRADS